MTASKSIYGQYAGFIARAFAFLIDLLIITIVAAVVAAITRMVLEFFLTRELINTIAGIFLAGFVLAFAFLYFVFFCILAGQTPGKRLAGVRVVRTSGQPVTFGVALRRFIGYFISGILFLGFLWVLLDARRQGWHDKIAGTYVIYAWEAKTPSPDLATLRERLRRRRMATPK